MSRITFQNSLKTNDFTVTAQINLEDAPSTDSLLKRGEVLQTAVDAVQLYDSTRMHMSGIAAAALLIQQGIDPIVHMNCRDRNRIALLKDMIGAAALGVENILLMRGKKVPDVEKLGVRSVFDVPALELMAYVQSMKETDSEPELSDLQIGAGAEVFNPGDNWTPKNLLKKCDAGASFVQLQPCFDLQVTRNYMSHIVASKLTHRARFVMALSPLPSVEAACWVRDNVKGALVPEAIISRLEQASDPEQEGIEICAEQLQELATIPGVAGANLLTIGPLEMIPAAVAASGVRDSRDSQN